MAATITVDALDAIVQCVRDVLGDDIAAGDAIDADASFVQLGLSSIHAARFVSMVCEQCSLGTPLSALVLLEHTTPRRLSLHVRSLQGPVAARPVVGHGERRSHAPSSGTPRSISIAHRDCRSLDHDALLDTFSEVKEHVFTQLEAGDNNLAVNFKTRLMASQDGGEAVLSSGLSYSLFGAGGHCRELVHQLTHAGCTIDGIFDDNQSQQGTVLEGILVSGGKSSIKRGANWLLSIGQNEVRKKISSSVPESNLGKPFVHPSVGYVPASSSIGSGSQICENVRIGPNVKIGKHCIISFGASIAHDCIIEDFAFIAERCVLAGAVHVGEGALIGIGAVVAPQRSIGNWSTVMTMSAVCQDIPERYSCGGVPAVLFGPADTVKLV